MNLNIENWKEFKIKDIFRLEPTKGVDSTELLEGNDINYIGAKHEDNGLMLRCQLEGFESWVSKGNCIVFIQLGAGSAGYVNYIPDDFIGMNGKTLCGYIDGIMNSQIGLFLETVLCKERPKYSFGRSWTGDRLRETIIKLPADSQGNPDWKFMEDYINSINSEPITTKNKQNTLLNVETKGWKEYKLGQLFNEIYKADAHVKNDIDNFEHGNSDRLEFITRTDTNNGCDCFVNKNDVSGIEKGNAIIIGDTTSTIYYQANNFVAGDHIVVCRADWINKYTALFLKTLLEKERYRYSYGRAFKMDLIKSTIVNLPTKDNQPDWEYMENYIKSLPYGDRI